MLLLFYLSEWNNYYIDMVLDEDFKKTIKNKASLLGKTITVHSIYYAYPVEKKKLDWDLQIKVDEDVRSFFESLPEKTEWTYYPEYRKFEDIEELVDMGLHTASITFISDNPEQIVDQFKEKFNLKFIAKTYDVKPRKQVTNSVYDMRHNEIHIGDKIVFYNRATHTLGNGEVEGLVTEKSLYIKGRAKAILVEDVYVVDSQYSKIIW